MSQKEKKSFSSKFFSNQNPIAKFFTNLSSLLEENGKWSSMRFASLFATILPLFVWAFVSIKTNTIANFPESIAIIVVGSLGSKWLQKRDEIKGFRDSLTDLKTLKFDPVQPANYGGINQSYNQPNYNQTYNTQPINNQPYIPQQSSGYNSYNQPQFQQPVVNSYVNTDEDDGNSHNMLSQEQSNDIHPNNLDPSLLNNPNRKPRIY